MGVQKVLEKISGFFFFLAMFRSMGLLAQVPFSYPISYRVCPWFENKKAAVAITFDDNCPGQFLYALPVLQQKGLKATFFVLTGAYPCGQVSWDLVDSAFAKGHEIGSHSVSHLNMANSDSLTIEAELSGSFQFLRQRYYPQQEKITMAYPFGRGGGSSAQDRRIRRIASKYYYGGRSAGIGTAGFTGYHDYQLPFYDRFYMQLGTLLIGPNEQPGIQNFCRILDSTIQYQGIYTNLYHGIESGGFSNVPIATFSEQMDSLKARESTIWITTFGKIVQYHAERRALPQLSAGLMDSSSAGANFYLRLSDTLSGNWFRQALTIRLQRNMGDSPFFRVDSLLSTSGPVRVEQDSIQFNLVPGDSVRIFGRFFSESSQRPRLKSRAVMRLFPNPTNQFLRLELPGEEAQFGLLRIFNATGNEVFFVPLRVGQQKAELEIPAYFRPGLYWANFTCPSGKVYSAPFLKEDHH